MLMLAAAITYLRGQPNRIDVREADVELGHIELNEPRTVAFVLRNPGSDPVKILGASASCAREGCGMIHTLLPTAIAPSAELDVTTTFEAKHVGNFVYTFHFYTDVPGQHDISLTVRGEASDAKKNRSLESLVHGH
jgi:hypothetical protein